MQKYTYITKRPNIQNRKNQIKLRSTITPQETQEREKREAVCKEILGYIRGKYTQVPIPGAETTLNQSDLLAAATGEKLALITRLREYFDQTSRQSLLERRAAESVARKSELGESPMTIYIG